MGTSQPPRQATRGLGCRRYPWCVRETATCVEDGSSARFHLGAPTTMRAGDDTVTVALVATDDTGTTYVEVEATEAGRNTVTVWLTADEAGILAATLTVTAT
jgi:hypothetical protein